MTIPLAEQMRPNSLHDIIGQSHLIGTGQPLQNIILSNHIPNMIFYGPSGVGKTSIARIIAQSTEKKLHCINGTSTSTSQMKDIIDEIGLINTQNGIMLYLDEIQYLNKKQQQFLLEHIENGNITLIASTTENPYFSIHHAILSRCSVFKFNLISKEEIKLLISNAFQKLENEYNQKVIISDDAIDLMSFNCGGDVRKAINCAELSFLSANLLDNCRSITKELIEKLTQKSVIQYDKTGTKHYDLLSAFQKSIRGSDENAAIFYLAMLLEAEDIISICRRLVVIACEDIGLAFPQAIPIVKSCCDIAKDIGLPEARLPLSNAVILLATAPKSNSSYIAINDAMKDINNRYDIPIYLKSNPYIDNLSSQQEIYKYPHDYINNYVAQDYLPKELQKKIYYNFGDNKLEQAAKKHREKIKNSL